LKQAKKNKQFLLTFLLIGLDNTPVTSFENGEIDDYFKTAYTYLQATYPNSQTNKLIAPYFAAMLKKDKSKTAQILNDYKKQKWMLDFSGGE
jgi:hypothetical protein